MMQSLRALRDWWRGATLPVGSFRIKRIDVPGEGTLYKVEKKEFDHSQFLSVASWDSVASFESVELASEWITENQPPKITTTQTSYIYLK